MNKTIITSVAIICTTITLVICHFINSNERIKINTKFESIPMDRFTICINTVMTKSKENNKAISAGEAKDICSQAEKV